MSLESLIENEERQIHFLKTASLMQIADLIEEDGQDITFKETDNIKVLRKNLHARIGQLYLQRRHSMDVQEKNQEIRILFEDCNFKLVRLELGKGDYASCDVNGQNIVFERKEDDFFSSLFSGHLYEQLLSMYENKKTKAYYLIITKSYDDLKLESEIKGLTPNLLPGLVISLCQMGFVPLFVDDPEDSVKIISELCERFKDDPDRTRVINRSVNITTNNIITFPGVGNEKAERLITHFGSIRGVCNASIEELKQVYGVGNKLAKKIYNLSNGIVEDD